ncbi:MAG: cytochrome c [Planctomycetia bacterium]|nr:cytochrome c [Planctomycetia bacterium]
MKRLATVAGVLAVLVLSAGADNSETQTTKQLMGKLHKGANAPLTRVKAALKAEPPNWKKAQDAAKELVILGAGLPKTAPSKGDKANYQKLATSYYNDARSLDDAAKGESKAQASAALTKLDASCKSCHMVHKGK